MSDWSSDVCSADLNNAKEGGSLVPTLIFGIPGSGGTAILLGGMILLGVEPGITMVTQHLSLVSTIIWTLAIANVVGAGTCILLAGLIARLSSINFNYLAPFMFMLIMFAAFPSRPEERTVGNEWVCTCRSWW